MAPNSLNISVTCPSKVVVAARELGKPKEGLRGWLWGRGKEAEKLPRSTWTWREKLLPHKVCGSLMAAFVEGAFYICVLFYISVYKIKLVGDKRLT